MQVIDFRRKRGSGGLPVGNTCLPYWHPARHFRTTMRLIYSVLLATASLFSLATPSTAGTVTVESTITGTTNINRQIAANSFIALPLGNWAAGDAIAVRVNTDNNPLANDLTACLATADEATQYAPARSPCRGRIRTATPFELRDVIRSNGPLYLILDNSYANFIVKKVSVNLGYKRALPPQHAQGLRDELEKVRSRMNETFTDADFNIRVKSCGQANAFSERQTADITLCTELLQELADQQLGDTMIAILLHEYGHSLLNKWGEPGSSEEDMADQFATAILLKGGDRGRAVLMQWAEYWKRRNSADEARKQIQHGDTHTLSVQRARNIQQNIIESDELLRRWNKMLYRHMTRHALEHALAHPGKVEDPDLASEALQQLADTPTNSGRNTASDSQPSQKGSARSDINAAAPSERCTMSLQCDRGQACRRHRCETIPSYEKPLRQIPPLESMIRGGNCLGDEHCAPGLICSALFAKCEIE